LPDSISGKKEWHRLIVTLSWFTSINPNHQAYRRAHLWFNPYGKNREDKNCQSLLDLARHDADWHATRRGTVQHEIFEGTRATAFEEGAEALIQVNCRAGAGKLTEEVPYALAVTLEVAPEISLPIYEEIRSRIRPRIRPPIQT
jgi:hypothetical protein